MKKMDRGMVLTYSLPRRLLVLFLVFALVIYAIAMAVILVLQQKAQSDVKEDCRGRITQLSSQLDDEFERIQSQITYILTRSCVQRMELMTASVQFSEYYDAVQQTSELVHSLQNSSGLIDHAVIFFPRLGKSVSYDSVYNTIAPTEYQLLEEYQKRSGHGVFLTVDGKLYLISDSMRFADKTNSAVIVVEFSRRALAEWCGFFLENDAVGMLYRMDGGGGYSVFGNSLLPEERERFQADLKELFRQAAAQSEEETAAPAEKALPATSRVKLGGVEYLRFLDSVDAGNLWAASYVNVDSLRVASEPFLIWQIIFTVFLILEILLFLYLIHRMIAKPMARFANEVSQLEEKGMLSSQERPGGDMDFLYRSFVDVSNRLKTALEKEYRSKLMIYQSEIKFIQAQVRPHFLYNSFYHLYRMAKMEDNEGVAEMSLRLSSYYRYITRSNENVVPLQMEYLDSCLEVFLRPFPQKNEYLNFEMNASGALLLQIGSERKGRRFLHAEDFPGCYPEVFPFREQACWGVRLSVPTAFLQTVCEISAQPDPSDFEGNFYKCGDSPAHFLCWNPVESESPDFHRPEFFASFAPLWNESDHKN